MKIRLSASTFTKAQALFADETDAIDFICGTVQQVFALGTDKAIAIFNEQARFAEVQLLIAIELAQKEERTVILNE